MAGAAVTPVDSKDLKAKVDEVDSLAPPEHDLKDGPWKPRQVRQWKSPLVMLTFFVIGLGMSIGHCVFYPSLDGIIVGDSYNQERNIRQAVSLYHLCIAQG
jgi:thiol:disulfide interchange protein